MESSKKIWIIAPSLLEPGTKRGGGIEEIDYQVASHLSKKQDVVIIGTRCPDNHDDEIQDGALTLKFINFPSLKRYPPRKVIERLSISYFFEPMYSILLLKLFLEERNGKPGSVVVHNGVIGFTATIISKIMGIRIYFSEGNTAPWIDPLIHRKWFQKMKSLPNIALNMFFGIVIGHLSTAIRAQSESIKKGMIERNIDENKICVIPGGVDTSTFYPKPCNRDASRIGFVGRLTDEKGAPILIKMLEMVEGKGSELKFLILGDGPYRPNIEVMNNVDHLGFVQRNELPGWLNKISIAVFFQKELGLAEIECLSCGIPMILVRTEEISKYIVSGENGILCDLNSFEYLDNINKLLQSPMEAQKISENARLTALKCFSWDVIGNNWDSFLNSNFLNEDDHEDRNCR